MWLWVVACAAWVRRRWRSGMRVRSGVARRVVRVAVACAVGVAGVGLWAGPALAVQCPSRAKECRDWAKVPGRGWMTDVVCPEYRSSTVTERVRNLTSNVLTRTLLLTTTLWRKEIMVSETIEHLVSKFTIPGGKIKVTFPLTI